MKVSRSTARVVTSSVKKALEYIYDDMMGIYGKQGNMETEHLKIFRKFGWLLSQEQRLVTDKWIKFSVAHAPTTSALQAVTDDVATSSIAVLSGEGAASSSSSSSKFLQIAKGSPAPWVFPHTTPTKSTKNHDNKNADQKSSMMKLFGSKAIIQ